MGLGWGWGWGECSVYLEVRRVHGGKEVEEEEGEVERVEDLRGVVRGIVRGVVRGEVQRKEHSSGK